MAVVLAAGVWWFLPDANTDANGIQLGGVVHGYQVVNEYPHDPKAFTQGLVYRDGFLFESTGQVGQSSVRKVRLETGEVVQQQAVDPPYFAEGLADSGDRLIQLTWQAHLGFVRRLDTFEVESTFRYAGEGWGLASDGTRLIMSDGSDTLRFLDAGSFEETGRLAILDGNRPVFELNELEVVRGEIFANVWHSDRIARIDPRTGWVTGWIDLTGLMPATALPSVEAVLNGIAYDAEGDRLFVTGKWWPKLFEIRIE